MEDSLYIYIHLSAYILSPFNVFLLPYTDLQYIIIYLFVMFELKAVLTQVKQAAHKRLSSINSTVFSRCGDALQSWVDERRIFGQKQK